MDIIAILVVLIVVGVGLYLVQLLPMDATMKQILYVLVVLFVILWIISMLFGIVTPIRFR